MKLLTLDSCDDCRFVYWYLGTTPLCRPMDKKPCWEGLEKDEEQPEWCPLPNASKEILEMIAKLEDNI